MKRKIKINFVDFWSGFNKENNAYVKTLRKYYDVEISETPDFLFYSCFGNSFLQYTDCVKIFFTGENIIPNFNQCDYGVGFDYLDFGDRYFRRTYYMSPVDHMQDRSAVSPSMLDRRFCNFIYSNDKLGEGAAIRQEFCKRLMEYKHVDCPGRVLHNMDTDELTPRHGGDWGASKREFIKKYKFTIAFENSCSNGYTTEKLFDPLMGYSVPIYWGNPLVVKDFNPKAFINCNDYGNDWDAVIARVKELDNDPEQYLNMLRESPLQPTYDFDMTTHFEDWLVHIIEHGKQFNKDPLDWQGIAHKTELNKLHAEKQAVIKENQAVIKENQKLVNENNWLRNENFSKYTTVVNGLSADIKKCKKSINKKMRRYRNITVLAMGIVVLTNVLLYFIG